MFAAGYSAGVGAVSEYLDWWLSRPEFSST